VSQVFDTLVAESGLSAIFAKTVVDRVVRRAGMDPAKMQGSDVERLLPDLERTLIAYLGDGVAQTRMTAIKRGFER
jgi:hypothetical protein